MSKNGPWAIPDHWEWFSIGEKTEVVGGGTPSTKDESNFEGGTIPWITPADLSGFKDKYIQRGRRNITDKGLSGSGAHLMPEGTVLFSSRAPIGYVAIASNPVSTNQGFKSFVPQDHLDSGYLYYYLKRAKDLALALASGTTFPEISGKNARKIPLPIPPLEEQKEIVAAIETQFARLDDAVAALQRSRTRVNRYRASVLKAACEGRIVPTEAELARQEGHSYEPASVLLDRIGAEREAAPSTKRGKANSAAPVDTSQLSELPEGWAWTSIDQVQTHLTSGSRDWSKYYGSGTGTFILAQNVRPGVLDLTHRQLVNPPVNDRDRARSQVERGDILITIVGANTGDVCPVSRELPQHYVCQSVALMRPVDAVLTPFVMLYLMSEEHGQKQFNRFMYGQGRPHLSFDQLRSTVIALPPLAEQERIVEEVERRLSIIYQMEATVETNMKRAESLRQSILRRAFSGHLV